MAELLVQVRYVAEGAGWNPHSACFLIVETFKIKPTTAYSQVNLKLKRGGPKTEPVVRHLLHRSTQMINHLIQPFAFCW